MPFILAILFLFFPSLFVHAANDILPHALQEAVKAIDRQITDEQPQGSIEKQKAKLNYSDDIYSSSISFPLEKNQEFSIGINFYRKSSTIQKRSFINYAGNSYMYQESLKHVGAPFVSYIVDIKGKPWLAYDDGIDVMSYHHYANSPESIELKEWIYARKPNSAHGSKYTWEYSFMGRRAALKAIEGGKVGLHAEILVNGMDNNNEKERRRIIDTVHKAMPDAYIQEEPLTAIMQPIVYWTKEGIKKQGQYAISGRNTLTVVITEPPGSYPLIIDPTETKVVHVPVLPKDLDSILDKISKKQREQKVQTRENTWSNEVHFEENVDNIVKHIRLKSLTEQFRFVALLKPGHAPYQQFQRKINGLPAFIFDNRDEMIVYTQSKPGENANVQEWIYARKPNSPNGSQWQWTFKSDTWEWPMTMHLKESGEASLNRHVPISGFHIDGKAKDNFLLQMMVRFKHGDTVKQYFPFEEEIGVVALPHVYNKEGILLKSDVSIDNVSLNPPKVKQPKVGLDFKAWDDHWQTDYTITVNAKDKDYPLLLTP